MKVYCTWLLPVVLSYGAETAAWKVPLKLAIDDGLENLLVSKLEEAPVDPDFFQEGDELWDLSKAVAVKAQADPFATPENVEIEGISFEGEWVVWNARSQLIIARGSQSQLNLVEAVMGAENWAVYAKVTMDLRIGDGLEELIVCSRSGEKALGKVDHSQMEMAVNITKDCGFADLDFKISTFAEGQTIKVESKYSLKENQRVRVARWQEAGKKVEIGVVYQEMTFWGVPAAEVKIQPRVEADTVKVDVLDIRRLNGKNVGKDLSVRFFKVPPNFWERIDPAGKIDKRSLTVPDAVTDIVLGSYIDARELLESNGVKFIDPQALAGFDKGAKRLVVINTAEQLDIIEQIFLGGGCGGAPPGVEMTFEWEGGMSSLTTRSGEKALISKSGGGEIFYLEIAPNIGANGMIADVNSTINSSKSNFQYSGAGTFFQNEPLEIGGFSKGGHRSTLKATATISKTECDH